MDTENTKLISFFIWTASLLSIGLGWLFILGHAPLSAFFYNPYLTHGFVDKLLGIPYKTYLQSQEVYNDIRMVVVVWGWLLAVIGLLFIFVKRIPEKIYNGSLFILLATLLFFAFCNYMDNAWRVGQFFEHSLQFTTPLLLFLFLKNENRFSGKMIFIAKLAIAATFIGHGLFALGYYPVPGYFIDMVIKVFHFSEDTVRLVLKGVGWLDIFCAMAIFLPVKKLQMPAFYYIILWGFITACARIVTNVYLGLAYETVLPWIPQFLIRVPHFMLPLLLLLWQKREVH